MSPRSLLWAAALLAIAGALTGCREGNAKTEPPRIDAPPKARSVSFDENVLTRLGVKIEPAGSSAPAHAIKVPGTLDYNLDRYAEIGALLEGRVQSVAAKLGDHVKKGQVLATVIVPSIASAQAEYLTARAAANAAEKNQTREEKLLARELTTAREAEVAASEAAKANAALAAAEAKLRALRVGLPRSDSAIAGAGAHQLLSPIDGVVVRREAVLGAFLAQNQMAFAVADLSELWATLEVHEADLSYLRIGAEVDLSIDAFPGEVFEGKLALLDPQVGRASRAVRARVAVPNASGRLRPGLFVRGAVELPAPTDSGQLLVPAAAVQPLGETDVVFVERAPGHFEVRPVAIARRTAEVVELREGLSRGERIAVEGAFLLRGEAARQ